jgi:putative aldouronate transport system substrate-binding protein
MKKAALLSVVLLIPAMIFAGASRKETAAPAGAALLAPGTPITMSMWYPMHANDKAERFSAAYGSPALIALQNATGVTINYTLIPGGSTDGVNQSYNLLIASGQLTDVVVKNAEDLKKYPDAWTPIDTIIKANPSRYPNLTKVILEDPFVSNYLKDDDGHIRVIPMVTDRVIGDVLFYRQDALTQYGAQPPKTLNDWHTLLARAKADGMVPFMTRKGRLGINFLFEGYMDAVQEEYFEENGVIKYGVLDPRYKAMIEVARQWYAEGLIDQAYPTIDGTKWQEGVMNGQVFATHDNISRVEWFDTQVINANKTFRFMASLPMQAASGGVGHTKVHYPKIRDKCAVISRSAKNPERILDFYEYCLGPKGSAGYMLMNYGVEGNSYNMENGEPITVDNLVALVDAGTLKEDVTKKDQVKVLRDELYADYFRSTESNVALRASRDLYANSTAIQTNWTASTSIIFTDAERAVLTPIEAEVDTYRSEMLDKFIMGIEPMSNWDAFAARLKSMGLDKTMPIYQAALNRMLK